VTAVTNGKENFSYTWTNETNLIWRLWRSSGQLVLFVIWGQKLKRFYSWPRETCHAWPARQDKTESNNHSNWHRHPIICNNK